MSKQSHALPSSWLVQNRITEAARFLNDQDLTDADDIQLALESEQPDAIKIADAYVAHIQTSEDIAAAIDLRIERLRARAERVRKWATHDRAVVADMLQALGVKRLMTPSGLASLQAQPGKVLITDREKLPPEYLRRIPESSEPDKRLIGAVLRDGGNVEGAELGNSYHTLAIRV